MNNRKFGRTNLHVSEFCLNTTKFGWSNDVAASFALLDAYHACGGSFIQSLGSCSSAGEAQASDSPSEDTVGRWHEARAIARDRLMLASRMTLSRPSRGGSIAFTNLIRESCERSLRRLRTTHLDLLIYEWDEALLPIDDVLEAVDRLTRAGLVRYSVASGFPPWRVVDSLHRSVARNHARFEALQGEYSLITRAPFEAEALGMCREYRLGFMARSPLAGGFLAKRPLSIRESINLDRSWQSERFGSTTSDAVLRILAEIAGKRDASPAQIALAWVLRNPQVTSALVSAPSAPELRNLLRASEIILSDGENLALEDVTVVPDYRTELRHA